jgi:hypothetical protein
LSLERLALVVSAALLAPLAASAASAQSSDPLVSDRPDFTESASTVARGRLQVEAGYTLAREGEATSHALGELLLRVGVRSSLELRLGVGSYNLLESTSGDGHGFADVFLGAKLKFLDAPRGSHSLRPSVAVLFGTMLPTGAEGFGGDGARPEVKLAVGWDLSDTFALGSNLNLASISEDGQRFSQFSGSISLGVALTRRLGSYVEFFGFSRRDADGPEVSFLNGGLTFMANENLQLDGRLGVGFDEMEPNYFFGLGFAWRL